MARGSVLMLGLALLLHLAFGAVVLRQHNKQPTSNSGINAKYDHDHLQTEKEYGKDLIKDDRPSMGNETMVAKEANNPAAHDWSGSDYIRDDRPIPTEAPKPTKSDATLGTSG